MTDPNLNALWCRAIAEELARAGVAGVVLCPGSRNAPLLFALAQAFAPRPGEGDRRLSHGDERSAAFLALGWARTSGRPAVVCVTSGSAVANCAPALAEARAAGIPLIVVAGDRPGELHGCGAPQTMPQRAAFAAFVDHEVALPEPLAEDLALRSLRARVSRAAQMDGPVLIDVPLRDPLPPLPDPAWSVPALSDEALHGRADRPYTAVGRRGAGLLPTTARLSWDGRGIAGVDWLRPGLRGLIVAGPGAGGRQSWPAELARLTGWPLIADACSGARDGGDLTLHCADALLTGALADAEPEVIIAIGALPLARAAFEWIARTRCPLLLVEPRGDADFLARAWATVPAVPAAELAALCGRGDADWRERWLAAERGARARLAAAMAAAPWGEPLAAHLALRHRGFMLRHVASSMPVRHANLHADGDVACNRGVNGIDGTIGTFLGALRAFDPAEPGGGLLLIGDLAFLHDLPALAAARGVSRSAIVVLSNDGGGIFDFLPVAKVPDYTRWVRTPHGMDFAHAAAQFGCAHVRVADRASLTAALDTAASAPHLTVVECDLRGLDAVAAHRALLAEVGR